MNFFSIPTSSIKLMRKFITGEISLNIWSKQEPSNKNLQIDCAGLFIKQLCFFKEYLFEPVKSLIYQSMKDYIFFTHHFLVLGKFIKKQAILIFPLT